MATVEKIRVAIADDHPLIREGIKRLLEKMPDVLLVGEARNGQEAIAIVEKCVPDLLILDLQMPVMDGMQVIDFLYQKESKVIILILSAQEDLAFVQAAFAKGVWGYFLKEDAPQHLIEAIRKAKNEGKKSFSPRFNSLGLEFP